MTRQSLAFGFKLATLATALGAAQLARAEVAGLSYHIEPIVGFERAQKIAPTPHVKGRLIYGARAVAGYQILSAELEVTRASDNEAFPAENLTISETSEKAKLGLRSGVGLGPLLTAFARAGAQAGRSTRDETIGAVSTRFNEGPSYHPYAGAGAAVHLAPKISASADVTAVFTDFKDLSRTEFETTAGFSVAFP